MNKLTGFVTITRKSYDGEIGKAVAYTKDGSWFDAAVVFKNPSQFCSRLRPGDIYWTDAIEKDDEVQEASDEEIAFFKLKVGEYNYNEATSSKEFLESHIVKIIYHFKRSIGGDEIEMVDAESAERARKSAVKELAEKLLEMSDMNHAADMLGRIRDEYLESYGDDV